ncbi:carbohydrate ABC transporter permease [Paenibacillus sp. GCM10023252]|uniref:carbohydrate ABC transporter permease n=1 Tax=Paenibacillus sp. GCM10023252 TaxID=3252649 RepID=UPI0036106661
MVRSKTWGSRAYDITLYASLILVSILTMFPILHTIAVSFSSSAAAGAGEITIFPQKLSLKAYEKVMEDDQFFVSFGVSALRIAAVLLLGTIVTYLAAYPFSRETKEFKMRNIYLWTILIVGSFSGGIIPGFLNAKMLGLYDNFWVLVLPYLFNFGNVLLVFNFWRNLPKELDDCSSIDGAGPWTKLLHIYFPMSFPVLATISLFTIVMIWNDYVQAMIFINDRSLVPLQTYMQEIVIQIDPSKPEEVGVMLSEVSNQTLNAAKIVLTMLPIVFIYPPMQRFFIQGITLGSVKE